MSWNPTHVQVAVQRARDLLSKGKSGTNDVFVTIGLGKEKYQTTLKEKAADPEWYEECDLLLPVDYKESSVEMVILHRNGLGLDEFLGRLDLPLSNYSVHEPPRAQWYKLLSKRGHNKNKERGELEIRLSFIVSKVKDPDSLSTASSASKHLKSGKKMIKHAAAALGEKLRVKKKDKTTDHIPDLTGVDEGVLRTGDIEENYSSAGRPKPDTLSLPPASPSTKHSPLFFKKFAPFSKDDHSEGRGVPSSNASDEDLSQRNADSLSESGFQAGHRRSASSATQKDESISSKPPKHSMGKRGLLTKEKSQSVWEVSNTKNEFGSSGNLRNSTVEDASAKDKSRLSGRDSDNESIPGGIEEKQKDKKLGQRDSLQKPELVVNDFDSTLPNSIHHFIEQQPVTMFTGSAGAGNKLDSKTGMHSRQSSAGSGAVLVDGGSGKGSGHHGIHALFGLGKDHRTKDVPSQQEQSHDNGLLLNEKKSLSDDKAFQQLQQKDKKDGKHSKHLAVVSTQTNENNESILPEFRNVTKEVLVDMVVKMKIQLKRKEDHVRDLEEYIDRLLLRVMDGNPSLLQVAMDKNSMASKIDKIYTL